MSVDPSNATALLLDVDGVLIPYGAPSSEWGEWVRHPTRDDLVVSRQMVAALEALPADVLWLTSWSHNANAVLCAFIDWPPKRVLEKRTVRRWWKLAAVTELLASASYERIAWLDDDLDQYADEVDASVGRSVAAGRLRLLCPKASVGLTREDLDSLQEFTTSG